MNETSKNICGVCCSMKNKPFQNKTCVPVLNVSWVMIYDRVLWGFWAKLEIKLAFLCCMAGNSKAKNPKMPENDEFHQSLRPAMVQETIFHYWSGNRFQLWTEGEKILFMECYVRAYLTDRWVCQDLRLDGEICYWPKPECTRGKK